jgi:hypothetical protein
MKKVLNIASTIAGIGLLVAAFIEAHRGDYGPANFDLILSFGAYFMSKQDN